MTQKMLLSISEIIKTAQEIPKKEKVRWLRDNDSAPLRDILSIIYNKDENEIILKTKPEWNKNGIIGMEGMLYGETRRFKIFLKGKGYDNLDEKRREHLFIEMLEAIDDKDAELLVEMMKQKPLKGLSIDTIKEAFPNIFGLQ
jgi:hypothetical protein